MSRSVCSPRGFLPSFLLTLATVASGSSRAYAQQPPNDDCVNRIVVSDGPTAFSTVGATTDGGALSCGFGPAFDDVWFNYSPPGPGTLSISLCGSSFDTVLAVYDDCVTCPPAPLAEIACSDDDCGLQSTLSVAVTGQCYKIRVGGFEAGDVGSGVMLVAFTPVPPVPSNDHCTATQVIGNGVTPFDLTSASPDGPLSNCIGTTPDRDVWFQYTATCTGILQVDLTSVTGDIGFDAYDICTCPVTETNAIYCAGFSGVFSFPVVTGQCLLFRVYGRGPTATGSGTIGLSCFPPPAHDDCAAALTITEGLTSYDLRGATASFPDDPGCFFATHGADVWFEYTATCTGTVRIDDAPLNEAHDLIVYDTCTCPATEPTRVACEFIGFPQTSLTFSAVTGHCYRIRLAGFSPQSTAQGTLTLGCFTPPANDDCNASIPITNGTTPYDATGSTADGPPTCSFPFGDVWYDYIAPCTGALTVSIGQMTTTVPVAIYSGCACPVGPELGCAGGVAGATAYVVAGQCYKIRVGTHYQGPSTIHVACTPAPLNDFCVDRTVVFNGTTAYTTIGADTDGPNPTASCGDIYGDVWFNYTATCDGSLVVSAIDQSFNAALAVYSGCGPTACPPATELGCTFVFSTLTVPSVTAGQCFKIRVGNSSPNFSGSGMLTVNCVGTPANDNCAQRQVVTTGLTPFEPTGSTLDGPATSCGSPGFDFVEDVWFNYTATCTGSFSVGAFNDTFFSQYGVVVYGACTCPTGSTEEVPNGCVLFASGYLVVDNVAVGDCFKIRVGSTFSGGLSGPSTLGIRCHTTPANDDCATPQVIGNGDFPYDATEASTDGPAVVCIGAPIEDDVWFDYTATCDGFLQVSASSFNTAMIALYSGCACPTADFTEIPGSCGFNGVPLLPVTAGQCFKIRVGGAAFSPGSAGTLHVNCLTAADNDQCANRVPIGLGTTSFSTLGADTDGPAIPCVVSGQIWHDIWFNYTPSCDGTLTVSLCDSLFDTALAVYKGCNSSACPPTAAPEVCSSDFCFDDGQVTLPVLADQCYKIRVGGDYDSWGTGTITLSLVAGGDADGDGTPDCADGCPNDPSKTVPGECGCGVVDTDTDEDGVADCNDGCPNDPLKSAPGDCGCGTPDADTDADGTADCIDGCPEDPSKILPGICGCGIADTDSDGDGTADCFDGCPSDPLKTAPGICGCGTADTDSDGDGELDCNDGCPTDPLKVAPGDCGCGVAETDMDADSIPDCIDNCSLVQNLFQDDEDSDGVGDVCDNCVDLVNPDQADCDDDSVGDLCEIADGAPDCNLNGVPDPCDVANGTSFDQNFNLIPDECETNGGTPYCFGDSGCPCGNNSAAGSGQGCVNSTGLGAMLLGSGQSSLSNDQLTLTVSNLPIPGGGTGFVLFFQGTAQTNVPFQDGRRCVAGSQIRLGTKSHTNGTTTYPQSGDLAISVKGSVIVPGPRYYQTWYRNVLGPCGTFTNLSNGVSVIWIL